MATRIGPRESSAHRDHLYDFCIKFLRVTGIRLPIRRESPESEESSSNNPRSYCLKITLLHGTEQQNIGEFEVIGNESVINHQLSCQIAFGIPDKLHVYIGLIQIIKSREFILFLACAWDGDDCIGPASDQNWSAGLSGHITVDLKEFFDDVDVEINLEYPLFSSGSSHVQRTAKLEMSVLCTCATKKTAFLDHVDSYQEFMRFEDISKLRPSLDDLWCPQDLPDTERSHEAPSILHDSVLKQVAPTNVYLDKIDRQIEMLKEMEGKYSSSISTRPDVFAAVFFAAGMAFQRQVDSVNRIRMFRGAEDPLLLGESSRFLLEDVSPTSRSEASRNPEADSFCQSSSRSLVLSEFSSNSCGHGQSCSEAATSLAGDIDDDESDRNYLDSVCLGDPDMPMSRLESVVVESARSSNNSGSGVCEPSTSKETLSLIENESPGEPNSMLSKHNVLNVVGSVLSAFTIAGLSGSGSNNARSRESKDGEVPVAGSMLGRQRVTSIQSIRKSNPGLGWLSNSIQFK